MPVLRKPSETCAIAKRRGWAFVANVYMGEEGGCCVLGAEYLIRKKQKPALKYGDIIAETVENASQLSQDFFGVTDAHRTHDSAESWDDAIAKFKAKDL